MAKEKNKFSTCFRIKIFYILNILFHNKAFLYHDPILLKLPLEGHCRVFIRPLFKRLIMHNPIHLYHLGISFPHKTCFADFNTFITHGSRIAIIGRNGGGKSSLLKVIAGMREPSNGEIIRPQALSTAFVPQVIDDFETSSGGQRFNHALTQALRQQPDILLLDEPTNHLDTQNRKSLLRMLSSFPGTLIIATHDKEVLRHCIETLWHIDEGKIHVFSGSYDDYVNERDLQRTSLEKEKSQLQRQEQEMHSALMKEQKRASKSKAKGQKSIDQRKWPTIVSHAKSLRAQETSGRKKASISQKKQELEDQLSHLRRTEVILPKFSLPHTQGRKGAILSIQKGAIGYQAEDFLIHDMSLSLQIAEKIFIKGDNGSGKSTLIKAIMADPLVLRSGQWHAPDLKNIGYLDQHYRTLSQEKTVFEVIHEILPQESHAEIRCHLNDFLFRKNEEVNAPIKTLSGGEKARLSLACIAAAPPQLLILDEITNNLDFETRDHVIQVLKAYPGSMIVISHDEEFLEEIDCRKGYLIKGKTLSSV